MIGLSWMVTEIESIGRQVRHFFHAAQLSGAGHRKLIHNMRKLFLESGELGMAGEEEFFLSIVHCLNIMLAVRKTEEVVSRGMRFLLGFIVWSAEKDEAGVLGGPTPATRLIENLMLYALEGIDSRERLVRVRLAQLMVACVNSVDELGDGVWRVFRTKMTERLFDKEAAVRVQAVHAMSRLQQLPLTEDGSILVQDVFLELLAHDPVADVRKTVLEVVDVTEATLESIVLRRRDSDASVRKTLFANKMSEIDVRVLSIRQRDELLRCGLRDRDAGVRKAAIEMVFTRWIAVANNNLVQLLLSLDVIQHADVAESALQAFYEGNPDMFASGFPTDSFRHLTPETAIALRVYCEQVGGERAAELIPEMSELAGHVQRIYEEAFFADGGSSGGEGEFRTDAEFIILQILKVSMLLDTADEMGRRVMQGVLVELLANLELSETLFEASLATLAHLTPTPAAFINVVGALLSDLHDLYEPCSSVSADDEGLLQRSLESLSLAAEQQAVLSEDTRILSQIRCLQIIGQSFKCPSVPRSLSSHPMLLGLLNDAVIPAVNSPYAAVQGKGLYCLGLACLLSEELAEEYCPLIVEFYRQGSEETRLMALKIIFDLVLGHAQRVDVATGSGASETLLESISDALVPLSAGDDAQRMREIQSVAVEGFAKLLLHRLIASETFLCRLLRLYYDPVTADNPRLRQILSYFLQAFALSSADHQMLLAKTVLPLLESLLQTVPDANLLTIGMQLLELTDSAKLIPVEGRSEAMTLAKETANAHSHLAEVLAWAALSTAASHSAASKLYTQLLCRLRIDSSWSPSAIKRLLFVAGQLIRTTEKTQQTHVKRLVALLVELDDPTQVLEGEELRELRERLASIELVVKQPTSKPARPRQHSALAPITNVMDEISDML